MPYAICPYCGGLHHLNVGDEAAWYEERHPTIPVGSPVPARCFYCWQDINQGDRVMVRKRFANNQPVDEGEKGTCEDIFRSDEGVLFSVKLDSGMQVFLIRAEIRKLKETES